MLPSACYILSDEFSIPFFSTSNGYNNVPFEWTNESRLTGIKIHTSIISQFFEIRLSFSISRLRRLHNTNKQGKLYF